MKVWRGVTLTLWALLMMGCAAYAISYHSLETTALSKNTVTPLLARSSVYETARDQLLVQEIIDTLQDKLPNNRFFDRNLIQSSLASAVSKQAIEAKAAPVVDSVYSWLDSKTPNVSFSVSFADKKEAFYQALQANVSKKIAGLRTCSGSPYPPEDALFSSLCRPSYVSSKEATDAVMAYARSSDVIPTDAITADSFTLPTSAHVGMLKQIPAYLNLAWVAYWVAIAVFTLLLLLVVITRRWLGVVTAGASLLVAGIVVLLTVPVISRFTLPVQDATGQLAASIIAAVLPSFTSADSRLALLSCLAGAAGIGLGLLWRWLAKKHRKGVHFRGA